MAASRTVYVDLDEESEYEDYVYDSDEVVESEEHSDFSDIEENTVRVQFSRVYIDPLQEIFDKLDVEANSVLRTGKLSVAGEPGDMEFLQPLLFSMQAKEEEMPLILPQLMQTPFFNTFNDIDSIVSHISIMGPDRTLTMGRFRLGVVTDQLIYQLLSTHCCKGPGSRQADAVIETTMKSKYTLPSQLHQMQFNAKVPPPLLPRGYTNNSIPESISPDHDSDYDNDTDIPEDIELSEGHGRISQTSQTSTDTRSSMSSGIHIGLCKSPSLTNRTSNGLRPSTTDQPPFVRNRPGSCRDRKDSVYGITPFSPPYQRQRTGSGTGSFSLGTIGSVHHDSKKWHVDIPHPKDMMIATYGENSYPILHWNSSLKVAFTIGSRMRGPVAELESNHNSVTLMVQNDSPHTVAFAIRSHRQSAMFHQHIIFPKEGLQLLEPSAEWKKEMDLIDGPNKDITEHIVIDLLVCRLENEASWNVLRRYAVFKPANRIENKVVKRISHGIPLDPGTFTNTTNQKDLGYTLKQVIFHGLQCVVKNKLDQAETILTQALQLPIFQRISLKAFLFVCLAVLSNKRRKALNPEHVRQVMRYVGCLDQLVKACELAPNMAMPKMVGLVRQLRKELDPQKVIKSANATRKKDKRVIIPSAREVDMAGGDISISNVTLIIPGKALTFPIKVSLNMISQEELQSSLEQSPWATMLDIISTFCIKCQPPVDKFEIPVIASVDLAHPLPPNTPLRLLHSSFMSHWEDITSDPTTEVSVNGKRLTVRTDYTDWLVVASVKLNIEQLMALAMESVFREEPVLLQLCVYAHMFNDTNHGQLSAFITPMDDGEKIEGPHGHKLISFPHSFKAYNSQKLRFEFKGRFSPDTEAGQSDLLYNFIVDSNHQQVIEKKIVLAENTTVIDGKLIVSSYVTSRDAWETIREINLSGKNLSSTTLAVPI